MWKITWIQLMNRWRSNVWVCVELLLAFCLAWYMADTSSWRSITVASPPTRLRRCLAGRDGPLAGNSPDLSIAESDSIAMLGKL